VQHLNLLWASLAGLTAAGFLFFVLAVFLVESFWLRARRWLLRPLVMLGILGAAVLCMASVTQINLATQVYGTLPAASLPVPSASTLGGIESITSLAHNWIAYINTSGVPIQLQPNYTDLAGVLPSPGASALGGTESITCSAGSSVSGISTAGVPACTADTGANQNQGAPSGTINGSNTSFTLSPTPAAAANVNCFLNGAQQQQGAGNDYTISSATITYLTAPPTGSKLNCLWY
jgi:hypothetical protein